MNVEQMIQIVLVVLGIYFLYTIFITKKNTFFGGNNTEEETINVNSVNVNSVNVNSINENENELNEDNEINMNNIENENNVQGLDENELYEIENNNNILENNNDGTDCLNKNKLLPEDLLPKDVDSNLENGNGNENGNTINYLDAGRHIGINTVGQTLKNANRQIRSEPANPRQEVSPWNQSTIEHDNYRKEFELNESKVE
jgi:hypothetical protein